MWTASRAIIAAMTVTLSPELRAAIEAMAVQREMTTDDFVRELLQSVAADYRIRTCVVPGACGVPQDSPDALGYAHRYAGRFVSHRP